MDEEKNGEAQEAEGQEEKVLSPDEEEKENLDEPKEELKEE